MDTNVREMQNISDAELLDARKLIRKFPQCPLIRFDSERPVILKKLIELIGDELEDISKSTKSKAEVIADYFCGEAEAGA
jgi:hypothetical protein